MLVDVDPDDILDRKADQNGRISIGASDYAGKTVRIAIIETLNNND